MSPPTLHNHNQDLKISLNKQTSLYECGWPDCDFTAKMRWRAVDHILSKHYLVSPYPCIEPDCREGFSSKQRLQGHITREHKWDQHELLKQVKATRSIVLHPHVQIFYGELPSDVAAAAAAAAPPVLDEQDDAARPDEEAAAESPRQRQQRLADEHAQAQEAERTDLEKQEARLYGFPHGVFPDAAGLVAHVYPHRHFSHSAFSTTASSANNTYHISQTDDAPYVARDAFEENLIRQLLAENHREEVAHQEIGEYWDRETMRWVSNKMSQPRYPVSSSPPAPRIEFHNPPVYSYGVPQPQMTIYSTGNTVREALTGFPDPSAPSSYSPSSSSFSANPQTGPADVDVDVEMVDVVNHLHTADSTGERPSTNQATNVSIQTQIQRVGSRFANGVVPVQRPELDYDDLMEYDELMEYDDSIRFYESLGYDEFME